MILPSPALFRKWPAILLLLLHTHPSIRLHLLLFKFLFLKALVDCLVVTCNSKGILLMRALRAHIKLSIFENIFLRIEKVMTTFSIFEKIFLNIESLMCALRANINRTHSKKLKSKGGLLFVCNLWQCALWHTHVNCYKILRFQIWFFFS